LVLASPTSGGCSVGVVRSRTQAMEYVYTYKGHKHTLHKITQINLHPSQVSYAFLLPHLEAHKYLQDSYISSVMYRHKLSFFCQLSHYLAHTGREIFIQCGTHIWYSIYKVHITQSFTSANISFSQSPVHTTMTMLTFYKINNQSRYYSNNISLLPHINSTCQAYLSTYIAMYTSNTSIWFVAMLTITKL
jgi:hypothetical protein